MGVVDIEVVHNVMAKKLGIPVVNLSKMQPSTEALKRIPAAIASRYQVLPLTRAEGGLVVAVNDPTNMERMDEVRFVAGGKLIPVIATAQEIRQALALAYGALAEAEAATRTPEEQIDIVRADPAPHVRARHRTRVTSRRRLPPTARSSSSSTR